MSSTVKAKFVMNCDTPPGQPYGDLKKPVLLAFHGSGSNGTCHRVQLARLNMVLKKDFNILIFDGPFTSPAGPGILPFFEGCGPFASWLPPTEKVTADVLLNGTSTASMAPEVEALVRSTVEDIRAHSGRVAGLIGFSQGAKITSGLLRGTQIRRALAAESLAQVGKDSAAGAGHDGDSVSVGEDWCDFPFAINVCVNYPPPLLPPSIAKLLDGFPISEARKEELVAEKISIPVFHVLGNKDQFKPLGVQMVEGHYIVPQGDDVEKEGVSVRVDLDIGHHYPILAEENQRIGRWAVKRAGENV